MEDSLTNLYWQISKKCAAANDKTETLEQIVLNLTKEVIRLRMDMKLLQITPLINKRNEILDRHNNSIQAFELSEIKEIDAEIDRIENILR